MWPKKHQTCAIAALTGLAAFNVGGVTIHQLFQLPIEHDSTTASYWALSKEKQKVMKDSLCDLKMIIIDEVSMVSSLNLAYIHLRLGDIFDRGTWFGGKNIIFVGDLLQLPPFAITIHKSQGLSLDTAIIDLSNCRTLPCTYTVRYTLESH